ncbi:MAG: 30S ribosomal protein S18 [Acidimicrobiaceae bacterium]|nr:30S ribosomal protein S18 [Acidimicrobiaceae bacterium]
MSKEVVRKGGKKKVCIFCVKQIETIGYKDVDVLRKYMSDRGKIRARRVSGNCSQHQRSVAVAIKTARELALLPYTQRTVAERSTSGRGAPRSVVPTAIENDFVASIESVEELDLSTEFELNDEVEEEELEESE